MFKNMSEQRKALNKAVDYYLVHKDEKTLNVILNIIRNWAKYWIDCTSHIKNPDDKADAVQEVVILIWKALLKGQFDKTKSKFSTYCQYAIHNNIITISRKLCRKNIPAVSLEFGEDNKVMFNSHRGVYNYVNDNGILQNHTPFRGEVVQKSVEDIYECQELLGLIKEKLTDKELLTVELLSMGRTQSQVAKMMGESHYAPGFRLKRIRKLLGVLLK